MTSAQLAFESSIRELVSSSLLCLFGYLCFQFGPKMTAKSMRAFGLTMLLVGFMLVFWKMSVPGERYPVIGVTLLILPLAVFRAMSFFSG